MGLETLPSQVTDLRLVGATIAEKRTFLRNVVNWRIDCRRIPARVVDAAGYTVWRDSLGGVGTGRADGGNGNNQLDVDGYDVHFGQTAGSGRATSARTAIPRNCVCLRFGSRAEYSSLSGG